MHELGIIIHINKTVHAIAKENKLSDIGSITLEIGEVSGIVPDYLLDCWLYYRNKFPLVELADLLIESTDALTYCVECQQTYPTLSYGKQCPHCHSYQTYLVSGDECNIKEIEAQ